MSRHEPPHNSILIAVRREKSLMNFFHLFFVIFFLLMASSRSARIIISNVNFLFYFHFPGRWMGYVTVNHLRASWKNQQQKLWEGLFTLGKHAKEKNRSRGKRVLRPEISSPRLETRKWRKNIFFYFFSSGARGNKSQWQTGENREGIECTVVINQRGEIWRSEIATQSLQ